MLPLAAIKRIAKKSGVRRISKSAVKLILEATEEIGLEIAREAAIAARHAKRRTIKASDIKIASNKS